MVIRIHAKATGLYEYRKFREHLKTLGDVELVYEGQFVKVYHVGDDLTVCHEIIPPSLCTVRLAGPQAESVETRLRAQRRQEKEESLEEGVA